MHSLTTDGLRHVRLKALSKHFRFAGQFGFPGSPLYQALCAQIASDSNVLELVGRCRPGEPPSYLFMGAVHYLRLLPKDLGISLSRPINGNHWYRSIREMWLDNRESITNLVRWRRVQTNEVGRSSIFALGAIVGARHIGTSYLHHVDLGASAGLNLFWDQYDIHYESVQGPLGVVGVSDIRNASGVKLSCTVLGEADEICSLISHNRVVILDRVGIELAPVDRSSPEDVAWLRALIWSDHHDRLARFDAAISETASLDRRYVIGDATEILAEVCDAMLPGDPVVITHSFLSDKLTHVQRDLMRQQLGRVAATRPLIDVGVEFSGFGSQWSVRLWAGPYRGHIIASGSCHPHGEAVHLRTYP